MRKLFSTLESKILSRTLEKEINFENSLDAPLPFISAFLNSSGFRLSTQNPTRVSLSKASPPYTVNIDIYIHNPLSKPEVDTLAVRPESSEEIDHGEFFIQIHKEDSESLSLECISIDSAIVVHNIIFSPASTSYAQSLPSVPRMNFNTLSPTLQTLIIQWLIELGINEDIGKFSEILSYSQERALYKHWLSSLRSFIDAN